MTARLIDHAASTWSELTGWSLSRGITEPLTDLPLSRFEALVWWFVIKDAEPDDVERIRARLWQPPKGVAPKTGPWSAEAEMAAFSAVKAKLEG